MKTTIIAVATLCILAGCKKNDQPVVIATIPDVYIAGYENNTLQLNVAKYWKNGKSVSLSDGTKNAKATGITVKGNDVYVSGVEASSFSPSFSRAVFWKNGVATYLTGGNSVIQTGSIAVDDLNNVYVTGTENYTAKYWKNAATVNLTPLTDATVQRAQAYDIVLNAGDVYVSGNNNGIATYWKNGVATSLPGANASSIALNGSDVYTAGYKLTDDRTKPIAAYWKNTTTASSSSVIPSQAYDIAFGNNSVYIAFSEAFASKYWKDGTANPLADGTFPYVMFNSSIAVNKTDVYVASSGYSNTNSVTRVVRYWKNGTVVALTDSTHEAGISKIIVQ